jgi:hypothetical protein
LNSSNRMLYRGRTVLGSFERLLDFRQVQLADLANPESAAKDSQDPKQTIAHIDNR